AGSQARNPPRRGGRSHDGKTPETAAPVASLHGAPRPPVTEGGPGPAGQIAAPGPTRAVTPQRATPRRAPALAPPQPVETPRARAPGRGAVGSGPFVLKRMDAGKVELAAFPEHFAGRPYLDGLTLRWRENADAEARAYVAGEADFSLRGAVGFAGHEPKYPTGALEGPATILAYLAFGPA